MEDVARQLSTLDVGLIDLVRSTPRSTEARLEPEGLPRFRGCGALLGVYFGRASSFPGDTYDQKLSEIRFKKAMVDMFY
jgi:hypothetical protein